MSGTQAFDCPMPDGWPNLAAYLEGPDDRCICDIADSNLHVAGYFEPSSGGASAGLEDSGLGLAQWWRHFYWYSDRDPCARFIVPPLALSPELSAEYRQTLVDSPPSVIVFDPTLVSETTVPAGDGSADTTIVPFARIVASCYRPVPGHPTLYLPSTDRSEMSACIAREVAEMPNGGGAA
jgi:hypothetical protein